MEASAAQVMGSAVVNQDGWVHDAQKCAQKDILVIIACSSASVREKTTSAVLLVAVCVNMVMVEITVNYV